MNEVGFGKRRSRGERGASLIGLLIVVLIIAAATVFYFGRQKDAAPTRPGGPTTRLGKSVEEGNEVDCANNLRQIRLAIEMQKMNDPEHPTLPPSLAALKSEGINQTMLACPITHYPYRYNPATGQVWCVTQGHERF